LSNWGRRNPDRYVAVPRAGKWVERRWIYTCCTAQPRNGPPNPLFFIAKADWRIIVINVSVANLFFPDGRVSCVAERLPYNRKIGSASGRRLMAAQSRRPAF